MYKRWLGVFLSSVLLILLTLSACGGSSQILRDGLTVNFLDVGQGDCTFITFPDGKTMLIDTGPKDDKRADKILSHVKDSGASQIDYFVITHPDFDHIGNAKFLLENFEVKKAYLPLIPNVELFPNYKEILNLITEKNVVTEISDAGDFISADDYFSCVLGPYPLGEGGFYDEIAITDAPTDSQINNISTIIYLEYSGVRFLFMGDVGDEVETKLAEDYKSGYYSNVYGDKVNISNVDFLKVSHHGSSTSTNRDFLEVVCPSFAIISVGADNVYKHPSTEVLKRLFDVNNEMGILRTDTYGTVCVTVKNDGVFEVNTELGISFGGQND